MLVLDGHEGSINCIAVLNGSPIVACGDASGKINVWHLEMLAEGITGKLLQVIETKPRFFPLSLALSGLDDSRALIMAAGGTKSTIQIYTAEDCSVNTEFSMKATLSGHEGWIRSLDFSKESNNLGSDIVLASASQDKYIRLWRIHKGDQLPLVSKLAQDPTAGVVGRALSNKAHRVNVSGHVHTLTFEALLLGHEDWVYTALWSRSGGKLRLLSASADNSLAIWEADPASGVWVCITRLGEISAQKGSTTATGSAGGFWIGLWSPSSQFIVSLGRTGSWRQWSFDNEEEMWNQVQGVTGHTRAVKSLAWSESGAYLLSTSSDQTTRLHAEWRRAGNVSWHEFSRAQIHGYDLNCIDAITDTQFVSGADEKLLRVFDEPQPVAELLARLCGISKALKDHLPEAATMPVLGLSNKSMETPEEHEIGSTQNDLVIEPSSNVQLNKRSKFDIDHPPTEELLSRHTLWPEREKLYGHGYEISALATSHDGSYIATACKASSPEHAVIRLYETENWHEVKPSISAHSLTVTCLRFSANDRYLLSVGRDRRWSVFVRDMTDKAVYKTHSTNPKGHSRMILGGSWAPPPTNIFATGGRDKTLKIWIEQGDNFENKTSIDISAAVTAVDFLNSSYNEQLVVAAGTEAGDIFIYTLEAAELGVIKAQHIERR